MSFATMIREITEENAELRQLYYTGQIKLEYYGDTSTWARVSFSTSRVNFFKYRGAVEEIISRCGLAFQLDNSWKWEDIPDETNAFNVHQASHVYQYFVSYSNPVSYDHEKTISNISTTSDALYDYRPKDYIEAYNKHHNLSTNLNNYSFQGGVGRYGFGFSTMTKTDARELDKIVKLFNRRVSWKVVPSEYQSNRKIYICDVLMNDVEYPFEIVSLNTILKSVSPKPKSAKKLNAAELFDKVKNGEITQDEFVKLIGDTK